jgi:hypothetical protein
MARCPAKSVELCLAPKPPPIANRCAVKCHIISPVQHALDASRLPRYCWPLMRMVGKIDTGATPGIPACKSSSCDTNGRQWLHTKQGIIRQGHPTAPSPTTHLLRKQASPSHIPTATPGSKVASYVVTCSHDKARSTTPTSSNIASLSGAPAAPDGGGLPPDTQSSHRCFAPAPRLSAAPAPITSKT